jgi:lauroyl/myristoyl acyltransferase
MLSSSPALLSWMTGCKVLPVIVTRLRRGKYRIVAKRPVEARRVRHTERDSEIVRCTRELGASLFEEIQREPRQWYQFVPVGL